MDCFICNQPVADGEKADVVGPEVFHDACFSPAWNFLMEFFAQ